MSMCVAADELEFGNNVYHIKFDKSCSDKVHILTKSIYPIATFSFWVDPLTNFSQIRWIGSIWLVGSGSYDFLASKPGAICSRYALLPCHYFLPDMRPLCVCWVICENILVKPEFYGVCRGFWVHHHMDINTSFIWRLAIYLVPCMYNACDSWF